METLQREDESDKLGGSSDYLKHCNYVCYCAKVPSKKNRFDNIASEIYELINSLRSKIPDLDRMELRDDKGLQWKHVLSHHIRGNGKGERIMGLHLYLICR